MSSLFEIQRIVLCDALERLRNAVDEFKRDTDPATPLQRLPQWQLRVGHIVYEYPASSLYKIKHNKTNYTSAEHEIFHADTLAQSLVRDHGGKPSDTLRFARWLESIERWLRARAEGRRRHAQEILRQQQRAIDELKLRATAAQLRKGGGP